MKKMVLRNALVFVGACSLMTVAISMFTYGSKVVHYQVALELIVVLSLVPGYLWANWAAFATRPKTFRVVAIVAVSCSMVALTLLTFIPLAYWVFRVVWNW